MNIEYLLDILKNRGYISIQEFKMIETYMEEHPVIIY